MTNTITVPMAGTKDQSATFYAGVAALQISPGNSDIVEIYYPDSRARQVNVARKGMSTSMTGIEYIAERICDTGRPLLPLYGAVDSQHPIRYVSPAAVNYIIVDRHLTNPLPKYYSSVFVGVQGVQNALGDHILTEDRLCRMVDKIADEKPAIRLLHSRNETHGDGEHLMGYYTDPMSVSGARRERGSLVLQFEGGDPKMWIPATKYEMPALETHLVSATNGRLAHVTDLGDIAAIKPSDILCVVPVDDERVGDFVLNIHFRGNALRHPPEKKVLSRAFTTSAERDAAEARLCAAMNPPMPVCGP